VDCGAGFTTVLREFAPDQPSGGDHFEVYAESLKEVPLVVGLSASLRLDPEDARARLTWGRKRWVDFFSLAIEKDGAANGAYRLETIEGSCGAHRRDVYPRRTLSRDIPQELHPGEYVQCSWKVVGRQGTR
jgi:hypothetical protein